MRSRASTLGYLSAETASKREVRRLYLMISACSLYLVLGDRGRSWKRIFALAQKLLKLVWGMELRELPVREKMTLHEKRKGSCHNCGSVFTLF